ncbi:F-box/kelch-repeat protein At3g23880-like [Cornus florida]|uniref:F-box/kelch-repeat protein At3g23880-like n=1 Tax=Cornus florida TaxID=4283 RepID=UPI0028964005|nr:F-box/kelch-repeat protein At3g23880-like [Cornus florida]
MAQILTFNFKILFFQNSHLSRISNHYSIVICTEPPNLLNPSSSLFSPKTKKKKKKKTRVLFVQSLFQATNCKKMSDYLPNDALFDLLSPDVLIDVLTRLPIKTLGRCACVCKSWYYLITNPSFITTHLNRSSLVNNNHLLLILGGSSYCHLKERYLLLNEVFDKYAEFEFPVKASGSCFEIIGSCNGLLCIVHCNNDCGSAIGVYLWNPTIQKLMRLPPARLSSLLQGLIRQTMGFGFDPVTDDYKVVRIVYPGDRTLPQVDIFSLRTGRWRNISHLGLQYTISDLAPQACLNGAVHWLAEGWVIVSFHMGNEVFSEIVVPDGSGFGSPGSSSLVAKFQESLSLIHVQTTSSNFNCCIWVMKEYGISESWTKQFNIDMDTPLIKSVAGITWKGELLLATGWSLTAYDPKVKQFVSHELDEEYFPFTGYGYSFYAEDYIESLVLVAFKESPVLLEETSKKKKCMKKERMKRRAEKRSRPRY